VPPLPAQPTGSGILFNTRSQVLDFIAALEQQMIADPTQLLLYQLARWHRLDAAMTNVIFIEGKVATFDADTPQVLRLN